MSGDNQVTFTNTGGFAQFAESVPGVILGTVLCLVAIPFWVWNEARAARMWQELQESRAGTITLDAQKVDPANEGKLVHVQGETKTEETLTDDRLGISLTGLRLVRKVEMYQWVEEKQAGEKKEGQKEAEPTYSYKQEWKEELVSSAGFKEEGHENPAEVPEGLKSESWAAGSAKLGAFDLSKDALKNLGQVEDIEVAEANLEKVEESLKGKLKVVPGGFYLGEGDGSEPKAGDLRITFKGAKPGQATVVGKQAGKALEAYRTSSGRELLMVRAGLLPLEAMFENVESADFVWQILLRGGGWVALFMGILLLGGPLSVLSRKWRWVAHMIAKSLFLMAGVWATVLALTIAGGVWASYRPAMGGGLIVAALLIAFEYRRQTNFGDWVNVVIETSWTK